MTFSLFFKRGKILNCLLLQNIGGVLRVWVILLLLLLFLSSVDFLKKIFQSSSKILSGIPSKSQTVLAQTDCKSCFI